MKPKVKILFYAINGTGLGHLTRQYAIARQTRRLLQALGLVGDIRFLTTSEAPQLTQDLPTYKLPSKTVLKANRIAGYVEQSKFFISNLVASLRPELLVLDTVPEGSFQEFFFLKDYARRSVFIDRHKDFAAAGGRMHQSHLGLYDLILVPDDESRSADYPLPGDWQGRRRFIGPVTLYEGGLDRAALRQRFGFEKDWPVVYVSAGGGGDAKAQAQMDELILWLAQREYYVLAGYGPLFQGDKIYRANVVPLTDTRLNTCFSGLDYAISAAGYNSYQELLAAGVPTLFYAQQKGLDRQDLRIEKGLAAGWHGRLASLEPEALSSGLAWLETEASALRARLQARSRPQGAVYAAYELLRLHAELPGSPVDWRQLAPAMAELLAWRGEPDDYPVEARWRSFCRASLLTGYERQRLLETALLRINGVAFEAPERGLERLIRAIRTFGQKTGLSEGALQNLLRPYLQQAAGDQTAGLTALAEILELLGGVNATAPLLESWLRKSTVLLKTHFDKLPGLTRRLAAEGLLEARLEWLVSAEADEISDFYSRMIEETP